MADPNVQEVVSGVLIVVTLIQNKSEASIVMKFKEKVGHPRHVSIEHYLKAGMSEKKCLGRGPQHGEERCSERGRRGCHTQLSP
ncbi:hypothetical protein B0G76_1296 [Paraburkholderia sp. BL23I1N1]|uniref:hypothetical protein n=1 Tax=Paraburkholderia sp. BL23I1N1 TaxID=1938802 RepID=UPI000FF09318|nr:hypothetical protein [Paraburkholderia sp. BL23I1N1]RKE35235.1 hypothetical protein B0G76_1296 [Paraburkholderia sp. BL23I1N1]